MIRKTLTAAAITATALILAPATSHAQVNYPGGAMGISPFSFSYNYMTTGNPYYYGQHNYPYYGGYRSHSRYHHRDHYHRRDRYDRRDRYHDRRDRDRREWRDRDRWSHSGRR